MGWQENEAAKRAYETDKVNKCNESIAAFWQELLKANQKLLPAIRLKEEGDYLTGNSDSSIHIGGNKISPDAIQARNSHDWLFVLFDLGTNKLYGMDVVSGKKYYKIDSNSADILVKNICLDEHLPSKGLRRRWFFWPEEQPNGNPA